MEEIDYLISLLNAKKTGRTGKNVKKLRQVNYYMAEDDGNSNNNTATNLILPVLKTMINSKTDSMKNINKKPNKIAKFKSIQKPEEKKK